ncbi:MAG: peptide chain release factor N(5)-glutamine methyltransferase [Acidobacteria bacterium]|nr:peptide chain release factor N(5)-glutamine methyltransferase [Acidobacteriota bacterium]
MAVEPQTATVEAQLEQASHQLAAAPVEEPRRTAESLLGFVMGCERSHLFAHPERELSLKEAEQFQLLVERRFSGEPTQYILGVREFYGRDFEVNPAVLIPRPETELLIEAVLEQLPEFACVLDVGTGSGCIAVTLACERPSLKVHAVDISEPALAVAENNAQRHQAGVKFRRGDLTEPFADESFDVVVSNPPYVAERARPALSREVRREPELALFAGLDGLDVYRRLIPDAGRVLRPGGLLAMELGHDSLPGVLALLAGWDDVETRPDLAGIARIALARRPRFAQR